MMNIPEKIICVHNGALGDFLQAWPALYALTQNWPEKEFFWAGKSGYSLWTEPLGFKICPPAIRPWIESLYSKSTWPQALQEYLVIWFGLRNNPLAVSSEQLWFFPGLNEKHWISPRQRYAQKLVSKDLDWKNDWPKAWKRIFYSASPAQGSSKILLFPGSGHRAKCWPLDNFFQLARWLKNKRNEELTFVLGPVEQEQGLQVKKFEQVAPQSLAELQSLLSNSKLAIGNDCGPMHLAGITGIASLALFGPTCAQQWGPWQGKYIQSPASCSPCTQMAGINCKNPVCMRDIEVPFVQQYLLDQNWL